MSKSRLGISSFDLNIRFKDRDEAYRYAKRLIEYIRYICKKNEKREWSAQAMVCISNTKGNSSYVYYEHSGRVGRPKKIKKNNLLNINGVNVDWHLHILLVSKPMYVFRDKIKKYIDKNWNDVIKEKKEYDINEIIEKSKAYKKNTNIKKAEYFINQSEDVLFCNYSNGLIPKGYSLKDLYKAYMKSRTALIYHRNMRIDKRLQLEDKYDDIMNFYWQLTKKQDDKLIDEYMSNIRFLKIAENYEKDNKVQENFNIRRRKEEEDSYI